MKLSKQKLKIIIENYLNEGEPNSNAQNFSYWKKNLGKVFRRGINFHKLKDERNNYRAGLDKRKLGGNISSEFFKDMGEWMKKQEDGYSPRNDATPTLITLNGDNNPGTISAAKKAGWNVIYAPTGSGWRKLNVNDLSKFEFNKYVKGSEQGSSYQANAEYAQKNNLPIYTWTLDMKEETWEKIKAALDRGNCLIHCTHGADRTGATVARWYLESGTMTSTDEALRDAYRFKGDGTEETFMRGMKRFITHGMEGDYTGLGYNDVPEAGTRSEVRSASAPKNVKWYWLNWSDPKVMRNENPKY